MKNTVELAFPDFTKPFYLHTDASDRAVGATLSQYDNASNLRLLSCMSHKMNPAEAGYSAHERELLALICALGHWRHYLLGHHTHVLTDNAPLRWLQTQTNLSQRQARWVTTIAHYDIDVQHIPGATNTAADAISRIYQNILRPRPGSTGRC